MCRLIAHPLTYYDFEGLGLRILIEADYMVNAYESRAGKDAIRNMREKIFRTDMGKLLLITVALAYGFTLGAAAMSYLAAANIFPHFMAPEAVAQIAATAGNSVEPYFTIALTPIFDTLSDTP